MSDTFWSYSGIEYWTSSQTDPRQFRIKSIVFMQIKIALPQWALLSVQ